ncbi:peptidoglycan DD-metalloendopeptidase family protein [Phascolarctobacterium succinatutens]|uniref:peptidoglycan DD-metalloendopeptidase family protein n=1 Tax=Phascolarctobacterium succinatutens TaxID=626940 RepID=UPI0026F11DB2|nr:peptidoglycan DD-metalloendopeptidase family protein [Phascolarctobacterium succinatutens]
MLQDIIEQCKAKAQIAFNKLQEQAASVAAEAKAVAKNLLAEAQQQAEKVYTLGRQELLLLWEKGRARAAALAAVAKIRAEMYKRRARTRYQAVRNAWCGNQHFTFWLIPADGQHVARKHVKKAHIKYAFTGFASVVIALGIALGVLGHMAIQNEAQKQELAEYKQTKQEQAQKIQELQQMAEKNQKQLAYLSKLEDQVRSQMEKSGAQLPPKSDASVYAGKGGASLGSASEVNVMLEQEKNISLQAKAKAENFQKLLGAIENENYRRDVTPSQWPTDGGFISSPFGGRPNPFSGYGRDWHPGIDIAVDYGTPVYASAAGYVQQAGWYGGYGKYIRLGHDFGYETAYGHMSRLAVSAGSFVKKGEVIGYVGSTGYSTGPHLHFEILKYGEQVNPSSLM